MLKPGLYEQLVNNEIREELENYPEECKKFSQVDEAEAAGIISKYVAEVVQKELNIIAEKGGSDSIVKQIELANKIIESANSQDPGVLLSTGDVVEENGLQLLSLMDKNDQRRLLNKKASDIERPQTSLAQSSLFTGAPNEPQMFSELKKEIASADRIDMLVSFIKFSGLRLIIDELKDYTENGGHLRVITTSYMGATDIKAVERLSQLPNTEIKISYDTKITRLHAKTYVFYRNTGYSTAYVGSSNLSNAAMTSGLEWNIKLTAKDQPETLTKISATFETYWNMSVFEIYDNSQYEKLKVALAPVFEGKDRKYWFDVNPYSYQQEILDNLKAEREIRGNYRNLVVAATGTGKTVISALDYRSFSLNSPRSRLLFVAHREEILKQSLQTFQGVLKDPNFGELFVGSNIPGKLDYLFCSIQTLSSRNFCERFEPEYYDYIVVDEFHHACAETYQKILEHFKPKILLGLTATPERMDGKDTLKYFNGRIAAEIRLPEAIERGLLVPFQYFGVTDTADLRSIAWKNGGYDKAELTNLYAIDKISAEKRAENIYNSLQKYVTDINTVKGIGFCVSKEHARFMAEFFNNCGIPSLKLDSNSCADERFTAKERLVKGEIKFIFVVDLYNEGVDIPEINTVLFLRPTESLTIFLQQLGRGLRLSPNKDCLTVLDFVGQSNKKYNFEQKFTALLSKTKHSLIDEIKMEFISLPKGCYIKLEKQAVKYILENIRAHLYSKNGLLERIKYFEEESGLSLTLSNFLNYHKTQTSVIYGKKNTFSRLCVEAGVKPDFSESIEEKIPTAFAKLSSIDSRRLLDFLLEQLPQVGSWQWVFFSTVEKRMINMFSITVWPDRLEKWNEQLGFDFVKSLANYPVLFAEMLDLLCYQKGKIDIVDLPNDIFKDSPLDIYASYTRDQLFVALDYMSPGSIREGVKWLPDQKTDVFMVTLNKSDKDYSPTTMYEDYSLSDELFHWQSQSTTSDTSATGQRYINHVENGSRVLLFVREHKKNALGTAPYTFLGPVEYVSHNGSRPMSIVWKLRYKIPAKYIRQTNKLVA